MFLFSTTDRLVVDAGQVGLEYRDGVRQRVLPPGAYRIDREATCTVVDLRERLVPVAPQEVMTSDGVPVRVSLMIRLAVVDAVAFTERSADPIAAVYLAAQVALRELCAGIDTEALMRRTEALDPAVMAEAAAQVAVGLGIEVRGVVVRDVILPSEIRSAALELITAKARGLARLESARAETAALRALSNAGRMLEQYPALARMRLVQEAPYGTKVVMAVGADAAVDGSATDTD